jgi:hypothetical protein
MKIFQREHILLIKYKHPNKNIKKILPGQMKASIMFQIPLKIETFPN